MIFKIIVVLILIVLCILLVYLIKPELITGMFIGSSKKIEITSGTKALETGSNIAENLRNISSNLKKMEEILG
jgi:cell division protein YceG involved in septum cleavage